MLSNSGKGYAIQQQNISLFTHCAHDESRYGPLHTCVKRRLCTKARWMSLGSNVWRHIKSTQQWWNGWWQRFNLFTSDFNHTRRPNWSRKWKHPCNQASGKASTKIYFCTILFTAKRYWSFPILKYDITYKGCRFEMKIIDGFGNPTKSFCCEKRLQNIEGIYDRHR